MSNIINSKNSAGVFSIKSPYPFTKTVQQLISAFKKNNIQIFATIDQRKEAIAVGLNIPPTTLIIFGNPKAGTPIMSAEPLSGIDLPLKVLISEVSPNDVKVSFNSAKYIIERHSLSPELLSFLIPAEQLIAKVLEK